MRCDQALARRPGGGTRSPWIIPYFLPQQGCPRRCLFCHPRALAGHDGGHPSAEALRRHLDRWLDRPGQRDRRVELAFYGGSFTGLSRPLQEELLGAAAPELASGRLAAIRLSTRPDLVDDEGVPLLARHGVRLVELGVQSLDDQVLRLSGRGHDAARVTEAVRSLRRGGIRVACHLMVGLPGETTAVMLAGARALVRLAPDFVRIHPVLVLDGTGLARLTAAGDYRPLTLNGAIARVARLKQLFDQAGIPVLRMGLQANPVLEEVLLAGPYHPAFGELVQVRLMFRQLRRHLRQESGDGAVCLAVNPRDISLVQGPGRGSRRRLAQLGLDRRLVLVPDIAQPRYILGRIPSSSANPLPSC